MGVYLNPGNSQFCIAVNSEIYIDKTELIHLTNKVIDTEQRFVCISRPRRFGKSMAANMLVAYYGKGCDSAPVFDRFKISKDKAYRKYLNQYNVIAFNIQTFLSMASTVDDMMEMLQEDVLEELREQYPNIVPDKVRILSRALDKIYARTGDKFIFVIDEWDCILREQKNNVAEQKSYLDFIRNLLKDKAYVGLAYMTGILPIKKYGTHSALNMFWEYSMTKPDQFAEYVGFTEEEVKVQCERYNMDFEEMQDWYDGYSFKKASHIYNPRSVVGALLDKDFGSYWTRTETYEALKVYIELNFDGLRDAIIEMLAGTRVHINTEKFQNDMTTFHTKDDVLTLLVHLGYLAFNSEKSEVYIPNQEIQGEFCNAIEGKYWSDVVKLIDKSEELLRMTWDMNAVRVAELIDEVHTDNTSILTYNDENSLACVISLAYFNAARYYTKVRELPTGRGFADIVFIPKRKNERPAMIVELKYDKSAAGAISQIKDRKYVKALEEYQGNLLLVGINYNKRTKKHECIIERYVAEVS